MFYLSKIEHKLRLSPHLLNLPLNEAIKMEIENIFLDKVCFFFVSYADCIFSSSFPRYYIFFGGQHLMNAITFFMKVIANLGLCVSLYDIRKIEGGFIFPGEGASTYTVCLNCNLYYPSVFVCIASIQLCSNLL